MNKGNSLSCIFCNIEKERNIAENEAAGQTVMHLHILLIPRYKGDMENPRGGVRCVIPNKRIY